MLEVLHGMPPKLLLSRLHWHQILIHGMAPKCFKRWEIHK
jgi:hypothetical protein